MSTYNVTKLGNEFYLVDFIHPLNGSQSVMITSDVNLIGLCVSLNDSGYKAAGDWVEIMNGGE